MERILRSDIELYSDGGGKRIAAIKPITGFEKVQKYLIGVIELVKNQGDEYEYSPVFVNGAPAVLILRKDNKEVDSIQYIEWDNNSITRLLLVRNPDKLKVRTG